VRIHVIGVGTRHGDDAAGLAVAETLAGRELPPGVVVFQCERPVPDLLDAITGADAVVLVDAARTGAAPGSLQCLDRTALAGTRAASSHGLGVWQALALAEALGRGPARVAALAIEAGPQTGDALSGPVREALPRAAAIAIELARGIAAAETGS
jgi:hydrogenase maturation protease